MLSRKHFWIITANSTAAFVLSYLCVFYLNQLSYGLMAGMYHYPITLDYATYYFHVEPYQWTHDAVFLIFSSGYVLTFIVGILALLAFYSLLPDPIPVKIFFFWFAMHAGNFVFGGLLLGNLLTEGIGHVFNWMYMKDTVKMIISLIGFLGLLGMGLFSARMVAMASNVYFEKFNERIAPFYITAQVIVPYLIGSVLMFVYFFPKNMFHERYGWAVLGVVLLIFFHRIRNFDTLVFDESEKRSIRLMKSFMITTIVLYISSRLLFHKGFMFHG